jgi:hypothetical protein
MLMTVGATVYVNSSAGEVSEVPPGVATETSTVPGVPAGDVAVTEVGEVTTKLAAGVDPKLTAVAPLKLVPVTVTVVPPPIGPPGTLRPPTLGMAAKTKWSTTPTGDVPPGEETVTSTVPPPGGEEAITVVEPMTVKPAATTVPNMTALAVLNPVPVIVTDVPPATGPPAGVMRVTAGPVV